MKKCLRCCFYALLLISLSGIALAQPSAPTSPQPGGGPSESIIPEAPNMPGSPGPPSSSPMEGPSFAHQQNEPPGEIYFSAGIVSPDGKTYFVAFDRYLLKYKLPELKLTQKVDIGMPVAPVSPSISISPDGKWIYVIQNGTILQIEKESLTVKKTVPVSQ